MEEPETSKKEENSSAPPREKRVLILTAEADREWARQNFYFELRDIKHDHSYCIQEPNQKPPPTEKESLPGIRNLENTLPNQIGNNETLEDLSSDQLAIVPVRPRQPSLSGDMQTLDSGVVTPQRPIVPTLAPRSNSPQKIISSGRVLLPAVHPRADLPPIQSRPGEPVRTNVFSPEAGPVRLAGTAPLILASRGTKHSVRGRTVRPQNEMVAQSSTLSAAQLPRSPQRRLIIGEGIPQGDGVPGSMAVRLAPPLRSPDQKQISINRSPRIMRPALSHVYKAGPLNPSAVSSAGPPGEAPAPSVPHKEEVLPPHIRDVAIALQNETFIEPAVQYRPEETEGMVRVLREDPRPKPNIILSPSLARQRQISSSSGSSLAGSRRIVLPNSSPTRVPGSSPVRTNLDFNNHLKPVSHREAAPSIRSNLVSPVRNGIKSNLSFQTNLVQPEPKKRGRKPKRREPSTSNDEELVHDEESNEVDCICGTKEEFDELGWVMCDGCSVWQHAWCVGYNTKTEARNKYFCEGCDKDKRRPRPHTAEEAATFVRGLVENERKRHKKGRAMPVQREASPEEYVPKRHQRARKRTSDVSPSRVVMSKNARQLIALSGTANHFTGPRAPPNSCAKMMVAQEEVYGLVAMTKGGIPAGTAAMELFGNVAVPNEVERPEAFNPFLFYYDGFVDKNSNLSIQQKKENQICLDARKFAQDGRFVRRCCRPNSTIKHTFDGRQANFFIVARQNIAEREEITLPFEAGFRPKDKTLCRCSGVDGANCLLEDPNFIGPGFTDPPVRPPTPPPPPPPPPSPPRKTGRTRRSTVTTQEVAKVKEEKSEEESAVAVSARRGRTKSASSKKGSEKEEVKVEPPPKAPRAAKAKPAKEMKEPKEEEKPAKKAEQEAIPVPQIYVLPTDRNKMSREERKVRMYERLFEKVENKQKGGKKRGRPPGDHEPATDKGEQKEKKEEEPEEKEATSPDNKEPIETAQPPMKKRLLRRWETTEEAAKSKEAETPAKRRKVQKAPERAEQEAADILASMDNKGVRNEVNIRHFFEQLATSVNAEDYSLPADYSNLLKEMETKRPREAARLKRTSAPSSSSTRPKRERLPPKEKVEPTPPKGEKEPAEEIKEETKEAPPSEKVRRMDLQEYRKYRNSNPNKPETSSSGRRQGFIPTFDASQTTTSLPDLPLLAETSRRGRPVAETPVRSPSRRGLPAGAPVASTSAASQDPRTEERSIDHNNLSIGTPARIRKKNPRYL